MARKNRAKKPGLFDAPRYGWKNVQEVERHDSIIVAQQEVKVVSVRQDGGVWWVSAIDPETENGTILPQSRLPLCATQTGP
jgi:hypothetical protein